ncbi:MAG: 50S ribosomal protein L20 [Acidobacteriota bacterium]|nr:MAG: 50S ribosomal protein L20 [Acidobacteriota bacterium]
MPRVKRGNRKLKRRRKILKRAKGYFGAKSKLYRTAKEAVEHSLLYAYAHRRRRKRDFRNLWILRINAAARLHGLSYSRFVWGLKRADIKMDRKVLAQLAAEEPAAFKAVVEAAKAAMSA